MGNTLLSFTIHVNRKLTMSIMMVTQFDTTRQEHAETVKVMTPACSGYFTQAATPPPGIEPL
jgi:hypothetical protein